MADSTPGDPGSDAAALMLGEQERLGQELHDTLGPQLAAISMLAASLHDRLQARNADETGLAAKVLAVAEQAKTDVRALTKGLLPVDCDAEALMSALADLAEQTEETHGITCRFDCVERVNVRDNFTATRLYRIAREAVHNAVKHGHPRKIVLSLRCNGRLVLQVCDDGQGMNSGPLQSEGNGIRIMRHRCELIGGVFEIAAGGDGGAVVKCSIPREAIIQPEEEEDR